MSVRFISREDRESMRPVHAVWEITLACDLKCNHCGSRAGRARPDELSTQECLEVVEQLAGLGVREVTLIGGEAYLRKDWIDIVRHIKAHGMSPTMESGGRNLTEARIADAKEAGLDGCGISIDGMAELHDDVRGVPGSFDACLRALQLLHQYEIDTNVNTQIGPRTLADLRPLFETIVEAGAQTWQVQLTVAMGNAADNDQLLLQPYQLLELYPLLAELFEEGLERGVHMQPGNNIGYFGPYEQLWRGGQRTDMHFAGCNAGQNTMGLEADGTIKGCPSLPTGPYAGGNVRERSIEDIWNTADELAFTRERTADDLWGFCRSCYYADVCRAGCTWTSHVLFGRAGNNPYCHHRALKLAENNQRERIVRVAAAPGEPFDFGRFELVLEPLDAPLPQPEVRTHYVRKTLPIVA